MTIYGRCHPWLPSTMPTMASEYFILWGVQTNGGIRSNASPHFKYCRHSQKQKMAVDLSSGLSLQRFSLGQFTINRLKGDMIMKETPDASVMLEVMAQSTSQLDEILQRLRARETKPREPSTVSDGEEAAEEDQESHDEFKDCFSSIPENHSTSVEERSTNAGTAATNTNIVHELPSTVQLPEVVTASVWGAHDDAPVSDGSNSLLPDATNTFKRLQIETSLPRNRIIQAACSRFHTLFLNDMGVVFAYGHAMDGALGLGPGWNGYVAQPTMIDFFFDNLIVVQHVACGGDQLVGAHSAAVSQEGGLFTWGVGVGLGNGAMRSASTPQRIVVPQAKSTSTEPPTPTTATFRSVSCGSGFGIALTDTGLAFSWGKWSDGRLGLGQIPIIARTSRRYGGGVVRKQFQSFQLKPELIRCVLSVYGKQNGSNNDQAYSDARFLKVACGDAHCVGLTRSGELVTWGRGNSGQLGQGEISDVFVPTVVNLLNNGCWRDVAAGENWSMVLSSSGKVWSWGACGGAVLGHGLNGSQKNAFLAEIILQRHQRIITQRNKSSTISLPTLPRLKWMSPQLIPCFSKGIRISSLSAGAQHAAAISETGDLYMWGESYTNSGPKAKGLILPSLPRLVNSGQTPERRANVADIGTHSVELVVCGGRQAVAFTSGSFLARSMNKLLCGAIASGDYRGTDKAAVETSADIVLIVSGHRLLAHRLLLAQRSPVLREIILEEEQQQQHITRNGVAGSNRALPRLELLLPQLRVDVARALVEFIYTDSFSLDMNPHISYFLLRDVLHAAKLYKIPALAQLCRERLILALPSPMSGNTPDHKQYSDDDVLAYPSDEDDQASSDFDGDISSSGDIRTLNDDMKLALSDEAWADVILLAEGRRIPVHRCMMIARSEYFRAVLSFQRSAMHLNADFPTTIAVEDSYAGIVRVLRFIYYDQVVLPQSADDDRVARIDSENGKSDMEDLAEEEASDQLLEDLVAADKYGLERMMRLCEHAVCVTEANCLEVLAVAELVHAAHLKQIAMRFVQTHLAAITARQEEFNRFQADFPHLLEELYGNLRFVNHEEYLLREWHRAVSTSWAAQREEMESRVNKTALETAFPWAPLSLAVAFGTIYLSMMNAQEHEYPYVPAANIVAIAAVGGAVFIGWL